MAQTSGAPKSPDVLQHGHAILVITICTLSEVMMKTMTAFVVYIMTDFGFTYSFTISAISAGALFQASSFIVIPTVLHLPANIVFCLSSLCLCVSCLLLWFFRQNRMVFIVAIILESLVQIANYGCANALVSSFVSDPQISHRYLTGINGAWTIATFLFFAVGDILHFGSFWLFLEIMFALCFIAAILSFVLLPTLSINTHNLAQSEVTTVSIRNDIVALNKIKPFWLICVAFIFIATVWAYFYSTFGLWLKGLFHLNPSEFGRIAALCEGIGNAVALWTVSCVGKSNEDDPSNWKMSLQSMMCWSALVGAASLGTIWIINVLEWYDEPFCMVIIAAFFYGQETCAVAGLVLINNIVPSLHQGRAFSLIGIVQSLTTFMAQMTVADLYAVGGMQLESGCLAVLYVVLLLDLVFLLRTMGTRRSDGESQRLLKDQETYKLQTYT